MVMINKEHKKKIRIIENLIKAGKRNSMALRRINESVTRILDIKEKYNIKDEIITQYDVEEINEEIDEINKLAKRNMEE
jgi:beta-N-acetylhexosaminidase